MSKDRSIPHGIPNHEYFGILLPTDQPGGMDCSSVADGIGLSHVLTNPATGERVSVTLISRVSIYMEPHLFDVLSRVLYGVSGTMLWDRMIERTPGLCKEIVELWCFKRE